MVQLLGKFAHVYAIINIMIIIVWPKLRKNIIKSN